MCFNAIKTKRFPSEHIAVNATQHRSGRTVMRGKARYFAAYITAEKRNEMSLVCIKKLKLSTADAPDW